MGDQCMRIVLAKFGFQLGGGGRVEGEKLFCLLIMSSALFWEMALHI